MSETGLTDVEKRQFSKILESKLSFVDNENFYPLDVAERRIFSSIVDVGKSCTSWYLSFDHPGRSRKNTCPSVILTKEQEQILFLQLNFSRLKLVLSVDKVRDKGESVLLVKEVLKWHNKAIKLRNTIVELNLAIVIKVSSSLSYLSYSRNYSPDWQDLIASANIRLIAAAEKFDISRGYKFSTYAWHAVFKSMLRDRYKRAQHVARFMSMLSDEQLKDHSSNVSRKEYVSEQDDLAFLQYLIEENLASLTDKQKVILDKRWLSPLPNGKPYSLDAISKILGISRTSVQMEERKIKDKIKRAWRRLTRI